MSSGSERLRLPLGAVLWIGGLVVWGLTWLFGPPAAERAIHQLTEQRVRAVVTRFGLAPGAPLPREFQPDRTVVTRSVVLPLVVYCEDTETTLVDGRTIAHMPSIVLWYGGPRGTAVWQGREWLPGRASRLRRLRDTGY